MLDWRNVKLGDKVAWTVDDELDSRIKPIHTIGFVSDVDNDHVIVSADGMKLWVDDDTCEDFELIK